MSRKHSLTIGVECWKKRACIDCGCVYRYLFRRNFTGTGRSKDAATRDARRAASMALQSEPDGCPCPTCGLVQPDMVGHVKAKRHRWIVLGSLALFAQIALLGGLHDVFETYSEAGRAAAVVALGAAFAHLVIALPNSNASRRRNKARAQSLASAGISQVIHPGKETERAAGATKPMTWQHWTSLFIGGFASLVAAAPTLAKAWAGWPSNPGVVPDVCEPGDKVRMRFKDTIETINGLWKGTPEVVISNREEIGPLVIYGTTQAAAWGNTIQAKNTNNRNVHPYVDIKLPANEDLVGKTLRLNVTMPVTYPHNIEGKFTDQSALMQERFEVKIAPPGAGNVYARAFWQGLGVGGLLSVLSGFSLWLLAKGMRARANPVEVQAIGDDPPKVEPTSSSEKPRSKKKSGRVPREDGP